MQMTERMQPKFGVAFLKACGLTARFHSNRFNPGATRFNSKPYTLSMFTTTIEINSGDRESCLIALGEVRRQIKEGYTSGFDRSEEGDSFSWSSNLEPS
jgi:hypothetical protein